VTEIATETVTTMKPTPMVTPKTAHQGQQKGRHVREVHHGKRQHHSIRLPPHADVAATAAIFIEDANAPTKKCECKGSAVLESDKVVFIIVVE
jgi:hypothetical protein